MSSVLTILTVIFSVVLTPFLVFFCGIVILAALGKTLGVRRLYIRLLLKVFEVGIPAKPSASYWKQIRFVPVECLMLSFGQYSPFHNQHAENVIRVPFSTVFQISFQRRLGQFTLNCSSNHHQQLYSTLFFFQLHYRSILSNCLCYKTSHPLQENQIILPGIVHTQRLYFTYYENNLAMNFYHSFW